MRTARGYSSHSFYDFDVIGSDLKRFIKKDIRIIINRRSTGSHMSYSQKLWTFSSTRFIGICITGLDLPDLP